jgi:hypothetical protein
MLNTRVSVPQSFSGGATVLIIAFGNIDKVRLSEATFGFTAGGYRSGDVRPDACLFTGRYLWPLVVASIGNDLHLLGPDRFTRLLGHARELVSIMAWVEHVVSNDQVVLGVGHGLHVLADDASAAAGSGH